MLGRDVIAELAVIAVAAATGVEHSRAIGAKTKARAAKVLLGVPSAGDVSYGVAQVRIAKGLRGAVSTDALNSRRPALMIPPVRRISSSFAVR